MEEEEAMSSPTQSPMLNNSPVFPMETEDLRNPSFSHSSSPVNSIEEGVEEVSNRLNHSSEDGPSYSSDYGPQPLKRFKSPEEDRISALPDSVLHHILSFLPTRDSIKTGVLSKRWVKLWSFVPSLKFCVHEDEPQPRPHKFFRMIDGTLIFYSSTTIRKFVLGFDYYEFTYEVPKLDMDSYIDLWLRFAARRNLQELCFKFCLKGFQMEKEMLAYEDRYTMPQFLFDNSSLAKLRSRYCDYAFKGQVSWRSLKVLTIRSAVLTNNMLQRILLGSPLLEELILSDCWDITSVNVISSGSLKKLVIEDFNNPFEKDEEFEYTVMQISAPNLKSLGILGSWIGTNCHLLDVSTLIDAHIDFVLYGVGTISSDEFMETTNALLQKINHVEQLTIGTRCIQALSMAEDRGSPSPLFNSNWKCLTLKIRTIHELDLPGMAILLQNAPNLEKLVVDGTSGCYYAICDYGLIHPTGENFWTLRERSFSCLRGHLKTIEFVKVLWDEYYAGFLYAFVQFLLRNAMVLEKMVVRSWFRGNRCEVAQKLLSFPRASPRAVILLSNL